MNEKMNGGISTMRGIFCRLSFQKGGITAETIVAQGFDGGIFSVDTRQENPLFRVKRRVFGILGAARRRGHWRRQTDREAKCRRRTPCSG